MKRPLLLLPILALAAGAVWLAARGGGARRDPVERLVTEMVPIPGRDFRMGKDGTEITEATLGRVAWFYENLSTRPRWLSRFLDFAERLVDRVREVDWSETESHKPVGRKEPNAWGLHDMHGNVWEWTETADGVYRVGRGGSWDGSAGDCESSLRFGISPDYRNYYLGFRLCASGRADTAPASQASGARDGGASRAERGGDSGPSKASAHAGSEGAKEPAP